ncbi:MAG: peroxidase [Candidatus Delongbacteria bacterium]|nr:peroxidase [Candidatus Delongbacteria bacterium]
MTHHEAGLRRELLKEMDEEKADKFIFELVDHSNSLLFSEADKLMLDYALILTVRSSEVTVEIIEQLKDAGFDDLAIHDMCTIVAYFNFVNRIANGLGVELES